MEILLVTARWPYGPVTEFLDSEVTFLARSFERVRVVPVRPSEPVISPIPNNVVVDTSLADQLDSQWHHRRSHRSRWMTASANAVRRNPYGLGVPKREFANKDHPRSWRVSALLTRADFTGVRRWAEHVRPPELAYTFWLGASAAALRKTWPHVPIVSRAHGGDLFSEAHGWSSIPFQKSAIESVDLLASVSSKGQTYLQQKFPGSAHKTVVRRLGIVDLGGLASRGDDRILRVLSASSIDANKRVDRIAEVVLGIAQAGRHVEWTHLGDGPTRPAVLATLQGKPESLTVSLPGLVDLSEVHRQLISGGHDVFVNLSLSEGAPVSLMEAQCVGLPVVATAVGGTPEVAPPALNELVRPDAELRELQDAVLRAAGRPPEEATARREHWRLSYNAHVNYSEFAAELMSMAQQGRG